MTRSRTPSPNRRPAPPPPPLPPLPPIYPADGPIQTGGIDDWRTEPEKLPPGPISTGGTDDRQTEPEKLPLGPIHTGGIDDRRTEPEKLPPGPISTGGIDDRRTETTHEFDDNGIPRKPSVVIVPTYPHNRRHSSSSFSLDCTCGLGPFGNLILRILIIGFIALVVIFFLALTVFHIATKGISFPSVSVSVAEARWNGIYNGTYLASEVGRFSSRSASTSLTSVAYKFAQAEHQLRIDRRVDPYDGRPYYEFKSRPVTASDYVRRLRFFSGEPFNLVIKADDWTSATRATISVRREVWQEVYPGSPRLEVEREFLADGVLSVTYSAADVIYYKRFKRQLFS